MNRAFLPVCVKEAWYAVDAPLVVEVVGKRPWIPIPGASSRSPGVVAWQGRAVALVDLANIVDDAAAAPLPERERLVVVRIGPTMLALPADVVREVHDVDEESLKPPQALRLRYAAAEAELMGKTMPVLDFAALVRDLSAEHGVGSS